MFKQMFNISPQKPCTMTLLVSEFGRLLLLSSGCDGRRVRHNVPQRRRYTPPDTSCRKDGEMCVPNHHLSPQGCFRREPLPRGIYGGFPAKIPPFSTALRGGEAVRGEVLYFISPARSSRTPRSSPASPVPRAAVPVAAPRPQPASVSPGKSGSSPSQNPGAEPSCCQ
jgi:hypothetical protein